MSRLCALLAFVFVPFLAVSSAQAAAVTPSITYLDLGTVKNGTTTLLNAASISTDSAVDVFGTLNKDTKITFTYTLTSDSKLNSKASADLSSYGSYVYDTTKGSKYWGESFTDVKHSSQDYTYGETVNKKGKESSSTALVVTTANITNPATTKTITGTTTIVNNSAYSAYFVSILDELKHFSGTVTLVATVSSVPLPAAFPLFALALVVLFGLAYRRKARASESFFG